MSRPGDWLEDQGRAAARVAVAGRGAEVLFVNSPSQFLGRKMMTHTSSKSHYAWLPAATRPVRREEFARVPSWLSRPRRPCSPSPDLPIGVPRTRSRSLGRGVFRV